MEPKYQQNVFLILPHPLINFEIKNIIKLNLDLIAFVLEIICLSVVPLK